MFQHAIMSRPILAAANLKRFMSSSRLLHYNMRANPFHYNREKFNRKQQNIENNKTSSTKQTTPLRSKKFANNAKVGFSDYS
jgi:hypothetical protein